MTLRPDPVAVAAGEATDHVSSRREVLQRLAGLGLVAGGLMLPATTVAAKPKPKRQRLNEKERRQERRQDRRRPAERTRAAAVSPEAAGAQQRSGLVAQDLVSKPKLTHISYSSRLPLLTISAPSSGNVYVSVSGVIRFTSEHIALMKAGRRFRVTCKVLEADSNSADDFCFDYGTYLYYRYPYATNRFYFTRWVPSSVLNDDVDDGWWDSDDDVDDPYGLLTLSTSIDGGRTWTNVSGTRTNEVNRKF